jgi:hypothetical protein
MSAKSQPGSPIRLSVELTRDADGYPPFSVERLWAVKLGVNKYRLDSIPFYAYGMSAGDEVRTVRRGNELWVEEVSKPGGNSVFRIYPRPREKIDEVRSSLLSLGCPSEVDRAMGLVAVEVPAHNSIVSLLNYLVEGQEAGLFDFEEGVLRHEIPD